MSVNATGNRGNTPTEWAGGGATLGAIGGAIASTPAFMAGIKAAVDAAAASSLLIPQQIIVFNGMIAALPVALPAMGVGALVGSGVGLSGYCGYKAMNYIWNSTMKKGG